MEGLGADPYLNGIAFGLGAKAFSDTGVIAGGKVRQKIFDVHVPGSDMYSTSCSTSKRPTEVLPIAVVEVVEAECRLEVQT